MRKQTPSVVGETRDTQRSRCRRSVAQGRRDNGLSTTLLDYRQQRLALRPFLCRHLDFASQLHSHGSSLLLHPIERLLQQLQIARLAEFFPRLIHPFLLERIDLLLPQLTLRASRPSRAASRGLDSWLAGRFDRRSRRRREGNVTGDKFAQVQLSTRMVDIDPGQISFGVVVQNDPF